MPEIALNFPLDLLDLQLLKKHIENAVREKNMIAHALFNSEALDADKMYAEYAEAAEKKPTPPETTIVILDVAVNGSLRAEKNAGRVERLRRVVALRVIPNSLKNTP